ncbi:MAG: 1-(5-phosphoribosyl)-5-[(5-phosphoribosylamino)methylideneamino]imidazole-4-carboxamide isomerase [Thermoproteota archaeon]
MLVIPAVDIMGGKCVRLIQGDPERRKVYFEDPKEAADLWKNQGATHIHIVDLDAALGHRDNLEEIKEILKSSKVEVQIGGGIRTLEKAEILLNLGASRIIFGTAAVKNPKLVEEAIQQFGSQKIAVAIDERKGLVTFHGWKDKSETNYLDLARSFEDLEVGTIIFTSTSVDGTLEGPQMEKITQLVNTVNIPIIASGGVGSLDDLTQLADTGVKGTIVGTALYKKKFTLKQALEVVKDVS